MEKLNTFEVHPLWKFLKTQFGMDEAFRMFGPYEGANIIPKQIDPLTYEVKMGMTLSNTNYVGTHFGGSLYSMCDPFYMFILMQNLGDQYIVWDKSAKIDFVKPGKGTVKAIFHIPSQEIEEVKKIVAEKRKTTRFYYTEITNEDGSIVAKLEKELYIRKNR